MGMTKGMARKREEKLVGEEGWVLGRKKRMGSRRGGEEIRNGEV